MLLGCWLFPAQAISSIANENNPKLEESFRIKLWNLPGGTIEVSADKGKTWEQVGTVIFPTVKTETGSYKAARWVDDGRVAATAVNAIHIKTATNTVEGSGIIFSILPREFLKRPGKYKSYLSPDSSIYTDIPAGGSIFGGGYSPLVGNRLLVAGETGGAYDLPQNYVPRKGDKIYIIVEVPVDYPREMIFENRFGGKITINYFGKGEKLIGEVLRPVVGVGRFEGTKYASVGRIRADHAGVIDISTSPLGKIGGFQIVPAQHGSEMKFPAEATQWMVIGPLGDGEQTLEGKAPFFKYFIKPAYGKDDLEDEEWQDKLLGRFLIEIKIKGKDQWQPMPVYEFDEYYLTGEIPEWANSALQDITDIRILFPIP